MLALLLVWRRAKDWNAKDAKLNAKFATAAWNGGDILWQTYPMLAKEFALCDVLMNFPR